MPPHKSGYYCNDGITVLFALLMGGSVEIKQLKFWELFLNWKILPHSK